MDLIQQRILEIALQIPDYLGYAAKERRREMDRYTRGQLAQKYGEMETYLARVAKKAPLENVVDLDNLNQKLQRLIARLNTAPTGYAGSDSSTPRASGAWCPSTLPAGTITARCSGPC